MEFIPLASPPSLRLFPFSGFPGAPLAFVCSGGTWLTFVSGPTGGDAVGTVVRLPLRSLLFLASFVFFWFVPFPLVSLLLFVLNV